MAHGGKWQNRDGSLRYTTAERFWSKVEKNDGDGCWIWTGSTCGRGYGNFSLHGKGTLAHRVAWELTFGPVPLDMFVCHHCDTRLCVRPNHLFVGTAADNTHDAMMKGRLVQGETHPSAKLSENDVRTIRSRYLAGEGSQYQLAREYGVDHRHISDIVLHRRWKSVL